MRNLFLLFFCTLLGCSGSLNDPNPVGLSSQNVLFKGYTERPKHLDPALSYTEPEWDLIGEIYEPPLHYHHLKRPLVLEPLTLTSMPKITHAGGKVVYEMTLKPGILYQPHPALAKDAKGESPYKNIRAEEVKAMQGFEDFKELGTRELVAADYVNQIKRLALPNLGKPAAVLSLMAEHIEGLDELAKKLAERFKKGEPIDLTQESLAGAQVVDKYTWRVTLVDEYPQFSYWLTTPFFAPVPPEADAFYALPGMAAHNFKLDWQPLGTSAFYLAHNDPNREMVLKKNPNFHEEFYPSEGNPGDAEAGFLKHAGKRLPMLDGVVLKLEKESAPFWNKFLQGYYELTPPSGKSREDSDSFDQAFRVTEEGQIDLSAEMEKRGVKLIDRTRMSIWYMGFNWLDPVVGGPQNKALRQAISIALDWDEFISIFLNGSGQASQGPLPPGMFGYVGGEKGVNPVVSRWNAQRQRAEHRSLDEAKKLLAQAGYPNGRNAKTGEILTLYFDSGNGGPEYKSRFDWYRAQFAKLGIELVIRVNDYNRFQDKVQKGSAQIFEWGWNADYPDPENFLFLLYGPNSRKEFGGENTVNYKNPEVDRLFVQMKSMPNGPERQAVMDRMVSLIREDAPWAFAYHDKRYGLRMGWVDPMRPNPMTHDLLKYTSLEPAGRLAYQAQWNRPLLWPLALVAALVLGLALLVRKVWRGRQNQTAVEVPHV